MLNFLPPFVFSLAMWALFSDVPSKAHAPFSQETYLSLIGIIKYGPPLLLSIFAGYIVRSRINRRFVFLITAVCSLALFFSSMISIPSIAALLAVLSLVMTSVLYEPVLEVLCAFYGERTGNYMAVNNAMNLARTSARMLAPLLTLYVIKSSVSLSIEVISGLLLGLSALLFLFVRFPEDVPTEQEQIGHCGFFASLKQVFSNSSALRVLIVYSTFYLAVNYLEYFVTLLNINTGIKLAHMFSALGAGFVTSNFMSLVLKRHIKIKPVHLSYSLFLTALGLLLLPLVTGPLILICPFVIGLGNGISVPLGSSIVQQSLDRNGVAVFFGALETSISICGIISMGIGFTSYKLFGPRAVFLVDAGIIGMAAVYWTITINWRNRVSESTALANS